MARYDKCIARLNEAAGRELTDKEIDAVFSRIDIAKLDIKNGKLNTEQGEIPLDGSEQAAHNIIQKAAEIAAKQLEAEAAKHEQRAYLQILTIGARVDDYKNLKSTTKNPLDVTKLMVYRNYKGINIESMEQRVAGVKGELLRDLQRTWDSLGNDFFGFFQDEAKMLNLLRELRGEKSGDAMAKEGAVPYAATGERARKWANEVGFNIGKLESWAYPQHHGQVKVADAVYTLGGTRTTDVEANRKAWVDWQFERIDKSVYVDEATGKQFTDQQILDFLGKAFNPISTNGVSNMIPGEPHGTGKLANRHSEHRSIHYKDAESSIENWKMFGDKSLVDVLYSHIDTMARDIAIAEYWGPNDRTTWRTVLDMATKDAVEADRIHTEKILADSRKLNTYYEYSTRGSNPSTRPAFSAAMDGIAHLNTAAKGGMFALSSAIGDRAMFEAVSMMNNIPAYQRWQRQLSLLNPTNVEDRRVLQRNGLMLDVVRSDLTRFYSDFNTSSAFSSFTGKLANVVMRVTGMRAINEIPKAAMGSLLFDAIGKEMRAGRQFKDLPDSDSRFLRNWGITETDWKVWGLVERAPEGPFESTAVTPEGISQITDTALRDAGLIGITDGPDAAALVRRNATVKLLGAVNSESEFGIVTPGMYERAQFYATRTRGEVLGEVSHAVLQFKSFPWTQFRRVLDVMDNQDTYVAKAVVVSALVATLTLTGAMILQVKEMLGGKDPRKMWPDKDYDKFKFWGAAFMQGGALGIYGDFLSSVNQTRYGTGPLEALAGPTLGPAMEIAKIPFDATKAKLEGKESHAAAQALRHAKGMVPFANVWYAKPALDHMVWQRSMEAVSPGYLSTVRQKTMREYGQDHWWRPGDMTPDRAPDISGAFTGR